MTRELSRREMLKRSGAIGLAAAWTVPLVQVVSMAPASAESPSGGGGGPQNQNQNGGGKGGH